MNFVLIPFFIGINVTANETEVWTYGPEYTFDASISYLVSADLTEKPYYSSNITTTMKCRPKTFESLLCRFEDTNVNVYDEETLEKMEIDMPFEIKFNERGIENLAFQETISIAKLNTIRSIATQLSVGADFKENADALPAFVAKENYILGNCATLFTVLQYGKSQDRFLENTSDKDWNYSLVVLTLPDRQPGSNTVIQKRTEYKRCTKTDESLFNQIDMDIKIGKSLSKIQISGTETFKSQTEIHVKVNKATGPQDSVVRDIIKLELKNVEPAKEELPTGNFEETASLFFSDTMKCNFIL